jgi:GNAT superfamily N-acetyltransferase
MFTKNDFAQGTQSVFPKGDNTHPACGRPIKPDNVVQFRPVGTADREVLLRMYRSFDPLARSYGLPPQNEEARQIWVDRALQQPINMGAFSSPADLLGHSFLALSATDEAEIAFFVQQGYRWRGIGTALVKTILQWAKRRGLRRIWALTAQENVPAVCLLRRCGFRFSRYVLPGIELDLNLCTPLSA